MAEYTLTYWPLPFRGQFIRAVLTHVGASWDEVSFDAVRDAKSLPPAEQPCPFMGPPLLQDHATGTTLSQTQAILAYLGTKYALIPSDPEPLALTHKIIADANDVLYEMTLHNGAQMWRPESWAAFQPRLIRWMQMFETLGLRHGLTADAGHILGTRNPGLADLVAATLWGTMADKLPPVRDTLTTNAPAIAGLSRRLRARPDQVALITRCDAAWGDTWCSGQIEASLRASL